MSKVKFSFYSVPSDVIANVGEINVVTLNHNNVSLSQEVLVQKGSESNEDYEEFLENHTTTMYLQNATQDGVLDAKMNELNTKNFYINRAGELVRLELAI